MNFWERGLQVYGVILVLIAIALGVALCTTGCAYRDSVCTVNDKLLGEC